MKFALFQGCNIPSRVSQYADATQAVFRKLDTELIEIAEFNCCGYPARNTDLNAFLLSAAKNMAVAEKAGLDMLVMCKCCYGNLKKAEYFLNHDHDLKKEINGYLAKEDLFFENRVQIKHLLSVLYHDIGLDRLKENIIKNYSGLQIAASYGCHALRPSKVTGFDDPVAPRIFDELVEITGAYSLDWTRKLDCCGAPLTGINDRLALDMARKKIDSAQAAGAHYICTACPYTHLQFDVVQTRLVNELVQRNFLAPILYPQLLGLCLEIEEKDLGISKNTIDLTGITSFLTVE